MKADPKAGGLIFDLDGTIADSMPVHFIAYRNILREFGVEFTPELFRRMAGIPAVESVHLINRLYGVSLPAAETARRKEEEYERNMHLIRPVAPVVELIREQAGKLPMAVGTGGYRRLALKALGLMGLEDCFRIIVTSEEVSHPKPHPETFLRCAEAMGVAPERCQVFEDGPPGIEAARAAGMMVVDVTGYYRVTIGREL